MNDRLNELMEAIENDSVVKIRKLCETGVDLTAQIDMGIEYGLEDPDYTPVLFYAIRKYASLDAIEMLLKHGCNIQEIDDDGLGAIDIAIKFKRADVVQFCIDKGLDVNATSRKSGITPIILAACFNNTEIAQILIDNGANINNQDGNGMSTKDYAKKLGQKKMLAFLDERGAKYNRYVREAQQEAAQGDMKNRKEPSDDMGFDSI